MTSRSAWLAMSLTLVGLVAPGLAAAGDAARGAKLAYTCHGCHGIPSYKNSYPVYSVPKLGGQHAAYMVVALRIRDPGSAAPDDARAGLHAVRQDMQDVAAYLRARNSRPGARSARHRAGQTCVACHSNGIGIMPEYPNLTGARRLHQALAEGLSGRAAQERGDGRHGRSPDGQGHQRTCGLLLEPATRALCDGRDVRERQVRRALKRPG
jgi:cytochrome c553